MTVCQIQEVISHPFLLSSVIGCLLPSVLIIIQAVQTGLATEELWNPHSYFWLLWLDLLLLSTAAVKVEIQHKAASLSASVANGERRKSDVPSVTHPILNKISKIGRY